MKDAVCMTFIQLTQDVTVSFKLMVCSGHHVSLQVVIVAASVMNVHLPHAPTLQESVCQQQSQWLPR